MDHETKQVLNWQQTSPQLGPGGCPRFPLGGKLELTSNMIFPSVQSHKWDCAGKLGLFDVVFPSHNSFTPQPPGDKVLCVYIYASFTMNHSIFALPTNI